MSMKGTTMNTQATPPIEPIETTLERMRVTTVFGDPIREGNVTVVPVAEVRVNFGYGYGSGEGPLRNGDQPSGQGSGGGVGAMAVARPRGYLRISAGKVRFEPIMNQGRIALASIFLAAWLVFWVSKTIREAQRMQQQPARSGLWMPKT
jgi:uncharacterized spore protein YtfJ